MIQALNPRIRYGLDEFTHFLSVLGNPQKQLPSCIHIAGTNGKGSTLTYLASALQAIGLSVGTYTSPHFISYTERICINQDPISQEQFDHLLLKLQAVPGASRLTEFEILTALAFLYFSTTKPLDIVLFETGLGGRLDATNVIDPLCAIITRIGWDHLAILGHTLEDIAREKAGIIKPTKPVLTLSSHCDCVRDIFKKTASSQHAPIRWVSPEPSIPAHFKMNTIYQRENLALAKEALSFFENGHSDAAKTGLAEAQIWGRYHRFFYGDHCIVVDAAHNPDGMQQLLKQLDYDFPDQPLTFMVGFYNQKDAVAMMAHLIPFLNKSDSTMALCEFDPSLCWTYNNLHALFPTLPLTCLSLETVKQFLVDLYHRPKPGVTVITGSIYYIAHFKEMLSASATL